MASLHRSRLVNPHLGSYVGIAASLLVAMALLALLLEGLGTPLATLGLMVAAVPLAIYAGIALASLSREIADFHNAGRRVPAFFNGMIMAVAGLGGTGVLAVTGGLFISGFDALFLAVGIVAGLVLLGVMIAPFMRKSGAPTPATFLYLRFRFVPLRFVVASLLAVPLILLIAAEIRIAAWVTSLMTGRPLTLTALLTAAFVAVILVPGGMRSHSWSATAKAIAALLAILTPVTIAAVVLTNLPIPQLSHGMIVRGLTRSELLHSVQEPTAPLLAFQLLGMGPTPLSPRFSQPFTSIGAASFVCSLLMIMVGIAAMPGLLARCGATPSVYEARKSLGWAIVLLALTLITLSAGATFLRDAVVSQVFGADAARLPTWFRDWLTLGFAELGTVSGRVEHSAVLLRRDTALFALPLAAGQPRSLMTLALAGVLAASLAAAAQSALALGLSIAEDLVWGAAGEPASGGRRLSILRIAAIVAVLIGLMIALLVEIDPLQHLLWALALIGPTLFPVLALSIWWKSINGWGALASVLTGFTLALIALVLSEAGVLAFPLPVAVLVAVAGSLFAALGVSLMTPSASRAELETVLELRIPGGETVYDHQVRSRRPRA